MMDPIRELKVRAEILHKKIKANDARAINWLRVLPQRRRSPDVQRRDCLDAIAGEFGFSSWPAAKTALSGEGQAEEFGTLLYPNSAAHLNLWYAAYQDAVPVRAARQGYLLAYKRQFLVVDRYFIESLGLDPDDPDWRELGFDWVRPLNPAARTRLYAKRIACLPREEE